MKSIGNSKCRYKTEMYIQLGKIGNKDFLYPFFNFEINNNSGKS